jgi:hypothetical protein
MLDYDEKYVENTLATKFDKKLNDLFKENMQRRFLEENNIGQLKMKFPQTFKACSIVCATRIFSLAKSKLPLSFKRKKIKRWKIISIHKQFIATSGVSQTDKREKTNIQSNF